MNPFERIIALLWRPKVTWESLAKEDFKKEEFYSRFVLPWLLFCGLCTVISTVTSPYNNSREMGIGSSLLIGLVSTIMYAFFITGFIFLINELAQTFFSQKNFGRATQLVYYSLVPFFIGHIFLIIPAVGWLIYLCMLYSMFLSYSGFTPIMKTPPLKVFSYMITVWIGTIIFLTIIRLAFTRH